ncbi:hypothetical protein H257_10488 [Aphanomyces astaci]|uniref:Uncharacterized protein n=1 Tax=Aphanomyces astaci TaxID=112090 RepID=W4G8D1_APHAT|nr:hypothetical protein H257_10488 [Aphanomyces astaci]ETV75304.1 hypothetical protein H257_10488 [Aphanomyces astaci]|eukprot:XP_009835352.1 hypothetical protein H257_10488 [Aphanomyces astaci]
MSTATKPKASSIPTVLPSDAAELVPSHENLAERGAILNQLQAGIRTKLTKYLGGEIRRYHVDLMGVYWSQPVVIEASIARYRKYMKLVQVTPSKYREVPPIAYIALVIQAHQTDHNAYFKYWRKATNDSLYSDYSF